MEDSSLVEQPNTYKKNDNVYSYDDLFPALPESETPKFQTTGNKWRVESSVVTQVFYVPSGERKFDSEKFGEGESFRICQTIMKDTGAHIEISSGKDDSLTFLVTGKSAEVLDARRKILVHFQTQASRQISIPREHHRWILGKKGDRLRELEKSTSTKISVPSITDESDVITITGTKEGIEKAEHEIRTTSDEQSRKAFERFSVPKMYHPFVCGPYNEQVNKIAEETGARINIPPPSVQKDEIMITGEKEGVLQARERIEKIYKDIDKKCACVGIEVPRTQHKYIFGPRGSTIQEILQLTGVSVELPPADKITDTINLRGPQDKLGHALTTVYQKANSVQTVIIDAPAWIHKFVIGRKGANIKEFSVTYSQVHVEFTENKIKVEGPPEQVEEAVTELKKIVNDYVTKLSFAEVNVSDKNFFKHIIGKAGSNITRLKDELEVFISIDEKDTTKPIRIEGPKEGVIRAAKDIQDRLHKLENEKEKDVIIDHNYHRSLIGAKGENIREIRDKYTNVLITFPGAEEKSDIVKLRGPKDDVEQCHKHLIKIVKEIQESQFVIEVPIFKQFHKFIIGKGGANIKKIRDETQTKIDLPAEGDKNEMIVIRGKKENVHDARDRIQAIQNELANIVTEEVTINPKFYKTLIGAGGKLISAIMEECGGVQVKFPSQESKSDKVSIRGPKDDVERAKVQLIELSNESQLSSHEAEVVADPKHHRFLIGKNGASIKKIRDSTGARIIFPLPNDTKKDVITIIGKKEAVVAAKQQLEAIIKDIDNITEGEVQVDPKHHKHFVAKRGQLLQRISDECGGVSISFPRPGVDSDRVTLKGAKDCIEEAKRRIIEIASDLDSMVTIECVIPQEHHRSVMGSKGCKVQGITSDFDVQIKFPDRPRQYNDQYAQNGNMNGDDNPEVAAAAPVQAQQSTDVIRITGKQANCDGAKQALLDLVPVTEEMNVPFDMHPLIIGKRGADVRELMSKYDVHIELSAQDERLDIIKIHGSKSNLVEAKLAIARRVEEIEADRADRELRNYELQIEVDPMHHSKIIGRRGAVITKIRTNHNVQISFPRKEDEASNIIRIQGYQKNAEAARDEIMAIVSDLQDMVTEHLPISAAIHPRLIGQRGRHIRSIMEEYKVEISFPREGDTDPDVVTIYGLPNNVDAAREHLLNLEEEYMDDEVVAAPKQNTFTQMFAQMSKPSQQAPKGGFVVKNGPWENSKGGGGGGGGGGGSKGSNGAAPNTLSQQDFPDMAGGGGIKNDQPLDSVWASRRN